MLPRKFKDLIKTGELSKDNSTSQDNVYRLYARKKTAKHRERTIEKTMELANELEYWAVDEGAALTEIEISRPDWCWVKVKTQGNRYQGAKYSYEKLGFVTIKILSPVKKILDELIEKCTEDSPLGQTCTERSAVHLTTEMPEGLKEKKPDGSREEGKMPDERLIGYFRADHNGYRWYCTWFDGKNEKAKAYETKEELEYVGTQIIFHGFVNGISSLREFVYETNAVSVSSEGDEFNFYYSGCCCDYWVRFILRRGDYNMYIKCYQKESFFHMQPEEIYAHVLAEKVKHLAKTQHRVPCRCEAHATIENGYAIVSMELTEDFDFAHTYMNELIQMELSPEKTEKRTARTASAEVYSSTHKYFFPLKVYGEISSK